MRAQLRKQKKLRGIRMKDRDKWTPQEQRFFDSHYGMFSEYMHRKWPLGLVVWESTITAEEHYQITGAVK